MLPVFFLAPATPAVGGVGKEQSMVHFTLTSPMGAVTSWPSSEQALGCSDLCWDLCIAGEGRGSQGRPWALRAWALLHLGPTPLCNAAS